MFTVISLSAQSALEVSLPDVISGESIPLKSHLSSKGMVVIFFSAKCPFTKYYEERLARIISEYVSKGMSFVVVNSNSMESKDLMIAQSELFSAPYLLDKDKALANLLGAKKSPEVFVLNNNGEIYYSGAVDDNPQVSNDVRMHYLKTAVDGLLKGAPASVKKNRPAGCMIK